MAQLWSELTRKRDAMKDTRTQQQRIIDGERKAVSATPPPSAVEQYASQLERQAADERLSRLPMAEQRRRRIQEYLDREPVEPGKPHPRQERIKAMLEAIVNDPTRERAAFDLAYLAYEQHAPGMSVEHADALWQELLAQEQQHIAGQREMAAAKRAELEAQLAAIDATATALPSDANRLRLLAAAAQRGYAPSDAWEAVEQAEQTGEGGSEVLAKYADSLASYEAALAAGQVA